MDGAVQGAHNDHEEKLSVNSAVHQTIVTKSDSGMYDNVTFMSESLFFVFFSLSAFEDVKYILQFRGL